jgi:cell division septal protein FtsQ
MQKRNVLNSSRLLELKKRRHKIVINKIFFFLFGIIVIFIFLVFLSHLKNLNISNIEISGNQITDTNEIKGVIEQQTSGKYLWLFPKTNIFLYPENNIKNALQDKFKRLQNINLSIKNNKTLEVSLSERTAKYLWCGTTPPNISTSVTSCYFMDDNGYIFDQAPYFSGEVYFKFYGLPAQTGLNNNDPSGSYYSQQNFQQLVSFKDMLVNLGLKPASIYVTNDGNVDVFLSGENSSTIGPEIECSANADFQNVAENLEAALTTEPLQTEFKNKYSTLQYIDLRFGNKVYYKFSAPNATTTIQ